MLSEGFENGFLSDEDADGLQTIKEEDNDEEAIDDMYLDDSGNADGDMKCLNTVDNAICDVRSCMNINSHI